MFKLRKVYASSHGSGQTFNGDSSRYDPYKAYKFLMQVSGNMNFAKAGFQKITGLKMKTEVTEYREGGDDVTKIKTPGLVSFEPITCTRGMSDDLDMFNWASKSYSPNDSKSSNDSACRAQIGITLQDRDGTPKRKWNILSGWISDYETGDFDAQSSNVMVENMTIQHEGWTHASV